MWIFHVVIDAFYLQPKRLYITVEYIFHISKLYNVVHSSTSAIVRVTNCFVRFCERTFFHRSTILEVL